jgi:ATP-binding protein involved in chromosome partitioning
MNSVTTAALRAALDEFQDPNLRLSWGESKAVESLEFDGVRVRIRATVGYPSGGYAHELAQLLTKHLAAARGGPGGVLNVDLQLRSRILPHAVQRGLTPLPNIANIVAVASGKGGVGKSTVAANLALAWAAQGARVGLLDADIYGPSQPLMLGLSGQKPTSPDGKRIKPLSNHGVVAMSIGFLVDVEQPMIWRGPMVTSALNQLLSDTDWGELDYLVIDMPPGTGDIQLTLSQRVPVAGAVIVTTPQDIALADARKGLKMFEKVNVTVLGIVENMSVHVCSQCGHAEHIFGSGGGARMAAQYGVQLLGELPLDAHIRDEADNGRPTVVAAPDSARAAAYFAMARRTAGELARRGRDRSSLFPKIVIENT